MKKLPEDLPPMLVTPVLLDELRPKIYVKGGDYRLDTLPVANQVQQWGGRGRTGTAIAARALCFHRQV
jgi:bifunctional ADP-heptose synthase (sugar kinase/adenylyltransferase)